MLKHTALVILAVCMSSVAIAEVEMNIGGSARARFELYDNVSDSNKDADDKRDFISSRFRLNFTAKVNPNVEVFFQPQFSRVFGGDEALATGQASGNFTNPHLAVFAAYIHYTLQDSWHVFVGRQGLNYGDQRVIGTVGWRNDSRAFDALRVKKTLGDKDWVDLFLLRLEEENAGPYGGATTLGKDNETTGFYAHFEDLGPVNVDVYALYSTDGSATAPNRDAFATYGTLLKSNFGDVDLGLEYTGQSGYDSSQYDLEVGYKFGSARVFVAYGSAHKDYRQLYPTAHKFLGHADLFGRRNITEIRAGYSAKYNDTMSAKISYHTFSRTDDALPYYNLGGSAVGTGAESSDKGLADEVDLSWKWNFVESAHLLIGGAYVMPKEHLKAVRATNDDPGFYSYVQTGATF